MRHKSAILGAVVLGAAFMTNPVVTRADQPRLIASRDAVSNDDKPCERPAPRPRTARDDRRAECPRGQSTSTAIASLPANAPDTSVTES